MTKKVFISYSHKDESHREDLEEHLTMLKRNQTISTWHDRKIIAGEDWATKIDENLNEAEIILFLVSSSFLASDYCYSIEAQKAIEKQENGSAQIISIIIRPCDWTACEFSRFQAVPTDAKPITEWDNKDTAWLNAVNGIKTHIKQFTATPAKKTIPASAGPSPTINTTQWAEDTEISLTHRKVDKLKLSDIYVTPDIEFENAGSAESLSVKNSSELLKKKDHYLISGEEQQGKTSLLKYIFIELLKRNYIPIYFDAVKIKKSDVDLNIQMAINEQYNNLSFEEFNKAENKVILIDNIDELNLNSKFKKLFIESINEKFEYTILTCHSSFSFVCGEIPALDAHKRTELLGLGNKKREEIVQKWISIGVEENIEDCELYSQCDDLKSRLNIVIKKNIVPSKPIYILMLLQMFEANAQLNLDLTSYGHCYQQLIYQSFEKAKISKLDFDKYLNVLTELAWWIFKNDKNPNLNQLDEFFTSYCTTYLPVDKSTVIEKLTSHSILNTNEFKTGFKYPYIYYFFVGKKIAESYSDSIEIKSQVEKLLSLLHREDFANILIFITHHTKDSWVLTEIKNVLASLFDDQNIATLDRNQLAFMDEFMKKIPELILEQREIQKERDTHNQRLDDIERKSPSDLDESYEPPDILSKINKTFKGMEIAGQIIRNRHATLTRNALFDLANSGASAGLRFLEYFIKISDVAKNGIINAISSHLSEYPNLADREIEKFAEDMYLHLTYGVINATVRKIASSIGSKEAIEIYQQLEKEKNTTAHTLIQLAIELQFNRTLTINNVSSCFEKVNNNAVATRILKEMIIQHIYMFPVDYKEKQQLSNLLGISVRGQRIMDQNKVGKG